MSTKVSRRDFARASAAAGAAAAAFPGVLLGNETGRPDVRAAATAAAKRASANAARRVTMPPEVTYGGWSSDGRDMLVEHTLTPPGQTAPSYPGGWREGTTIPGEYYVEEKHYLHDERFIAEHFWLMADHENRIPKPGDYFVFEFGRGDSVIILRDRTGQVKGFHNVCRHRGSRLCLHDMDEVLPSEARPDGKPVDARLSVVQLGPGGNTPVFRCPYHAWTYDLSGALVSFPPGMPSGFDASQHGLHPAHVRTVGGFIYVSFARATPPDFDAFVANWRTRCDEYGTAQLKVVARKQYPTIANWKLALENFRECYHCQPAHTKSFTATHAIFLPAMTPAQRARIEQQMSQHGHPLQPRDDYFGIYGRQSQTPDQPPQRRDALIPPPPQNAGMGGGGTHLALGFVTASLDGKPVAPLLPARKDKGWTHRRTSATTGFSTSFMTCYDDHVACARFTPRAVDRTDVEIFWLANPDAKPNEIDVKRMMEVWDLTYREDRWIVENNHHGVKSGRYNFAGGQPYASSEGGPSGLVKWYMAEVVPKASDTPTQAS